MYSTKDYYFLSLLHFLLLLFLFFELKRKEAKHLIMMKMKVVYMSDGKRSMSCLVLCFTLRTFLFPKSCFFLQKSLHGFGFSFPFFFIMNLSWKLMIKLSLSLFERQTWWPLVGLFQDLNNNFELLHQPLVILCHLFQVPTGDLWQESGLMQLNNGLFMPIACFLHPVNLFLILPQHLEHLQQSLEES